MTILRKRKKKRAELDLQKTSLKQTPATETAISFYSAGFTAQPFFWALFSWGPNQESAKCLC